MLIVADSVLDIISRRGYESGMKFTHDPGAMKKFKRTSWKFQQTVQTPLTDLFQFVSTIIAATGQIEAANLTIDQVVFDPTNILSLFPTIPLSDVVKDSSVHTEHPNEVPTLLQAALADPIDFAFVPSPRPFVVYADHDEFVTFYANSKSGLNAVIQPLKKAGFKLVPDWTRTF